METAQKMDRPTNQKQKCKEAAAVTWGVKSHGQRTVVRFTLIKFWKSSNTKQRPDVKASSKKKSRGTKGLY